MSALSPMEFLRVDPAMAGAAAELSVDRSTGALGARIAIPLTRGRDGLGPSLSLSYSGYDPLSPFAHGWSLSGLPSIELDLRDGLPRYDGQEKYRFSGQELVPLDGARPNTFTRLGHAVRVFSVRIEQSVARVERWTDNATGRIHFRVRLPDGSVQVFGRRLDGESRIADPARPERTYRWLLEAAFDRLGNAMVVRYQAEDGAGAAALSLDATRFSGNAVNRYPKRILYGSTTPFDESGDPTTGTYLFEVVFDYGDHDVALPQPAPSQPWTHRLDPGFSARAGFEIRTRRLCRRVLMFHRFPTELGEPATLVGTLEMQLSEAADATTLSAVRYVGWRKTTTGRISQPTPWSSVTYTKRGGEDAFEVHELPMLGQDTTMVDLFGEGLPGLLTRRAGEVRFARNLGDGVFGAHELISGWPHEASPSGLVDFDGDGNLELAQLSGPSAGFYRFDRRRRSFELLTRFKSTLSIDASVMTADMTGDGRPDLVLFHERGLSIYPFSRERGVDGFDDPIEVTLNADRLPIASGSLRRFLADMTGDGLPDVVEVDRGAVRYYPNLGLGRFGEAVWMDSVPLLDGHLEYDAGRVLLADISGGGGADLLYLRGDGTVLHAPNQRGASFGTASAIGWGPTIPSGARVESGDFYGDGSTCLMVYGPWGRSTAGVQVLRLVDAPGPRQLSSAIAPLGAATAVEWGHSVRHYLRDDASGRGWESPLPSQRPVVNALHRSEPVDGEGVSERFRYHDGHYDARTRGFAMFATTDHFDADIDAAPPDVVPKMSRRFLHTGDPDYLPRFARFHYTEGGAEAAPQSTLEGDVRLWSNYDEAMGALTGSLVREEVFRASTGGVPSAHPLSVVESSQRVITTRLSDATYRTGVSVVPRESRTRLYEETPTDPRLSVQRTVETDAYLIPIKTLSMGLPRRSGVTSPARFDVQDHLLGTASTLTVQHIDTQSRFELAIPSETRGFEVHVPSVSAALADDVATPLNTALASPQGYTVSLNRSSSLWAARHLTHSRTTYWNDARTAPLALGSVGAVTLPYRTEQAAYDTAQLTNAFGALVNPAVDLPPLGYVDVSGTYYAKGAITRFGDSTTFYRMTQSETFDGGITQVGSDSYRLVATQMVDPVGNTTAAQVDYHLLAPFRITDANGTVVEVDYDPLGVTRSTSRYGDALTSTSTQVAHGFAALTMGATLPTFAAALSAPETALGTAETVFLYEYPTTSTTPMRTLALRAEEMVNKGPDASTTPQRAQVSLSYHDGFGRPLQSRMLVEPGIAWVDVSGTLVEQTSSSRWRVSGYVELDAKQQPRRTFEPFFRASDAWEPAINRRKFGVSATTERDALGRTTQVSFPNGTFTTTTYSGWSQSSSDPNDTSSSATAYIAARSGLPATNPEKIALDQALSNANTPISTHVNALGHAVAGREVIESAAVLVERSTMDVRGLSEATVDRRGLTATSRGFDRLGRGVFESSMDAGTHRSLVDAEGREAKHWHEGTKQVHTYDLAGRLTHKHVTSGATTWLAERVIYGEGAPNAADRNQLGRVIRIEDAAGRKETTRYGAFGEPLAVTRTLTAAAGLDPDWTGAVTLEASGYTSRTSFDALGRIGKSLPPDGTERRYTYLRSGPVTTLQVVTPDTVVRTILASSEYNARGQETKRTLGNGVDVASTYDAETLRLSRRQSFVGTDTYQDLRHYYDPVGNHVYLDDLAQRPGAARVINGLLVSAERVFKYDARYQLKEASGRVHQALSRADFRGDVPTATSFRGTQRVGLSDGTAVKRYVRTYTYDAGSNLLGWTHSPQGGGGGNAWVHDKWVSSTSNRSYLALDLDNNPVLDPAGKFDSKGQINELPNLRAMEWSARSQLRRVVLIDRPSSPDDEELYDYGADGGRLRKTTKRLVASNVETTETIYLDGCELRKIKVATTPILERWSTHVQGADARAATLYRWTLDSQARETASTSTIRTHYHLGSNVGNVSLELGPAAEVIGYEEYFPYGGTAFLAGDAIVELPFRTLRFAGKDQDDATGFYAFHFRYYAPYLGTWVSPDPAGEIDGPNQYWYARNNPATIEDPLGLDATQIGFGSAPLVVQTDAAAYFAAGERGPFRFSAVDPGRATTYERHRDADSFEEQARVADARTYEITYESFQSYQAMLERLANDSDDGDVTFTIPEPPTIGSTTHAVPVGDLGSDGGGAPAPDGPIEGLEGLDEDSTDPLAFLDVDGGGGGSTPPASSDDDGVGGGAGTGTGGSGPGAGTSGAGRGGPSGTGSASGAGRGPGRVAGEGGGRGGGAAGRRRARGASGAADTGRRTARGSRVGATGRRGSDTGVPNPSTVPPATPAPTPGLPGATPGGSGTTAATGAAGAADGTTGGRTPLPGVSSSATGTPTGLTDTGIEGGATVGYDDGTATGSMFGSEAGDDERGSLLSGGDSGTRDATNTDRALAALQIANGDYADFDENNPAARDNGGAGTFGWIDLGDWNQGASLLSAAVLAIFHTTELIRDARRLAGEIVEEGASLFEVAMGWVARQASELWDAAASVARRTRAAVARWVEGAAGVFARAPSRARALAQRGYEYLHVGVRRLFGLPNAPIGRGSTADGIDRWLPRNLREQLTVEEALQNPTIGRPAAGALGDGRWHASGGWVKLQHTGGLLGREGPISAHYNYNTVTGAVDDLKIVRRRPYVPPPDLPVGDGDCPW